jgi:hypothetical protein
MATKKLTPKQVRKIWIDALKSGRYRQGNGYLAQRKSKHVNYCCLGLLSELACKAGVVEKKVHGEQNAYGGDRYYLPSAVKEWAGIKTVQGEFGDISLAELNDQGKSFEEIAKVIESSPDGLFVKEN